MRPAREKPHLLSRILKQEEVIPEAVVEIVELAVVERDQVQE